MKRWKRILSFPLLIAAILAAVSTVATVAVPSLVPVLSAQANHHLVWDPVDKIWLCVGSATNCWAEPEDPGG